MVMAYGRPSIRQGKAMVRRRRRLTTRLQIILAAHGSFPDQYFKKRTITGVAKSLRMLSENVYRFFISKDYFPQALTHWLLDANYTQLKKKTRHGLSAGTRFKLIVTTQFAMTCELQRDLRKLFAFITISASCHEDLFDDNHQRITAATSKIKSTELFSSCLGALRSGLQISVRTDPPMRASLSLHVLILVGSILLAGCTTRPNSQVLNPVAFKAGTNQSVTVLAATNRSHEGTGFDSQWAGKLSYQRYTFSVPEKRDGTKINYPTATPNPKKQYVITGSRKLSEREFLNAAQVTTGREGIVGIFVHGYNYSYQEALFRMAQMGADAKAAGNPILFSWPSLASVTGYVGDRDAALASRDEMVSLVKALSTTVPVRHVVLLGHSMGGFLVMEAVRELKLQRRDDVLDKLTVVLAAPDIDLDVFRAQLRDIGRLKMPITLLVAKTDRALSASSFISGERARVGRLNINDPTVKEAAAKEGVRVIDISNAQSGDGLGHDRYASLAHFGSEFILNESRNKASAASTGAFVFNAAGTVAASPLNLVSRAVGAR